MSHRARKSEETVVFSLLERNVALRCLDALIGGTHDAAAARQLFDAVGAPAGDAGAGEDRRGQVERDIQRIVDEARIEIDVCRQDDVKSGGFGIDLRSLGLDEIVEHKFVHKTVLFRQSAGHLFQELRSRVADGIYRVSQAVDEAGAVVDLAPDDAVKIIFDFFEIGDVGYVFLQITHHMDYGQIGAAVLRPLQ